jgi:hypothetical protein
MIFSEIRSPLSKCDAVVVLREEPKEAAMADALLIYHCLAGMRSAGCLRIRCERVVAPAGNGRAGPAALLRD